MVAGQDLGDAAVGDTQLARDVARPDAQLSQFHDPHPHRVGQWPAVDEDSAQLVHLTVLRHLTCVTLLNQATNFKILEHFGTKVFQVFQKIVSKLWTCVTAVSCLVGHIFLFSASLTGKTGDVPVTFFVVVVVVCSTSL